MHFVAKHNSIANSIKLNWEHWH